MALGLARILRSDDLELAEGAEAYERVAPEPEGLGQKPRGLTKECKEAPEVQGISIPKQRWLRCDRLLHTLLACLLILSPWIRRQGLKEERFLPASDVSVEVSNCQVIVRDGTQPGIQLQHWFFMGTVKERRSNGTLRVVATMRPDLSSWFRCNIAVVAPSISSKHTGSMKALKALNVTVPNSDRPAAVLLSGGVVHGHIAIYGKSAAVVNATGTKALDEITIQSREQGLVQLYFGQSSASRWKIRGTSPVFVDSSVPVQLKATGATGIGRLRAPKIREDGRIYLCSETARATAVATSHSPTTVSRRLEPGTFNCSAAQIIIFEKSGDSIIHVDLPCETCQVKVGESNIRLTASSKEALDEVSEFIQTRQNLPWLIAIRIGGLDQSWVLSSTTAFTYFDASWFAGLSFGVLAPVTKHYLLTLEGDPSVEKDIDDVLNGSKSLVIADELDEACPSWRQTADVTRLLVEGLHLEKGRSLLAKGPKCRSGLVFQKSKTGFTLDWNPEGYPMSILIAILMNGCCAIALSLIVVSTTRNIVFLFLYKRLSERHAATHASQRLQVGLVEETDINVKFSHYPERGFHLVWSKEKGGGASSYVIRLRSSQSEIRLRVNAGEVETSASSTVSFFLSLYRADLRYAKDIFSISMTTISSSQEVGHTCWSSPVRIEPLWATAYLPFKVLEALLPKRQDKVSMSTFLRTACSQFTPPALTLVLEKLHVICEEGRVAEDFRIEFFFGNSLETSRQATESRKEESFAKTNTIAISDWFSRKVRAEGWTGDDFFGVDIEASLRLTPPFRDSMRSGATLFIHMVARNEQVIATGVADWNDLLDACQTRPGSGGCEFTFQADLVDAGGEILGALCLRPDFKSEQLDALGKTPLDPNRSSKVWFQDDVPGDVYQQGMDRFVVWDDADSTAVHVDLYLEQVGKMTWQLMNDDVRFSSQTFPWVVDADLSDAAYVCCRIIMVTHGENLPLEASWQNAEVSRNALCTSNWFFVVQTLTLRHLEHAYGAFCRMNNMHMEGTSASTLKAQGVQVKTVNVRGCSGLRRPFSFESAPEDLIKCSGGLLLASISHTIVGASDDRYRLRSYRVVLLEGLRLLEGNGHWCENHMVSAGFDASLHLQELVEFSHFDPIIDFAFHVLMSVYQLLCFFGFSCLGVAFEQFQQSYQTEAAAFDVLQVSGMEAHADEIGHLPTVAIGFFGCHMFISLLCIFVANVMQDTPGVVPHLADHALGLISTFTFAVSAFCLLVMLLFFLIGALLHPSSALKPLLVLGSCGAVVTTMWMQFSNLTRGLLKVIEFQVDAVFDVMLQKMITRIKQEGNVSSYTESNLDFALKKADNRFKGLDTEGKPIKQSKDLLFRCVKPDEETIKEVQDHISSSSLGKGAVEEVSSELSSEMTGEQLQQLSELYKHYLGKTSLDSSLEWRIFEDTDALTDVMLREHNMRLQLLNFGAITSAEVGALEALGARDGAKGGAKAPERSPLPKAYLMYKAICRDSFDQLAGMIVKWADPFFQWTPIVEKVTKFFDDSVPKYICSCAMVVFDGNRKDSVAERVLAKVAQHVEDTMYRDPAKTMKLNDLIAELLKNPEDSWASGLLYSETPGVYEHKHIVAFVKEQVKQALPQLKTTSTIPVYKLVAVFEQLIKGRVWWSELVPFLKKYCGFLDAEIDKEDLVNGFKHTSKGCGFMDYQDIPDVLMWMTDGGLWKAATVALLREIAVCGELGNENLGTEDDEETRVDDEWNPPSWPSWVLKYWREATDEEEDPQEGEASFLQKSDVPGFINDLMLDTERLTTDEDSEPVPGYPEWRYKAMAGMQGCPAEVWRYIDEKNLARLRGIPWEGFDEILETFDLDMPEAASRKIFSGTTGTSGAEGCSAWKGVPKFVEAPNLMRTIEKIQTQYRPISLSGFEKLLKNAGITLPNAVIASLFGQVDDIKIKIGEAEEFVCEDLVSLNELGEAVEKYLSGGMWLEAAYGVLQNDEIETSFAEVSKSFAAIDKKENGILPPSGVIKLMMSLQRTGIGYDTFADMILKDMRFAVNDSQLRVLFNMVDLSGNGSISKAEFIQGFYTLMRQLVPNIILHSLSVLPEQIASHILKALMFLLLLFAFLFVSMDALTPSSAADVDFMGGVQAVVAGMAALGVRVQSTSGMDLQSIKEAIAAHLSELLPGVKTNSRN